MTMRSVPRNIDRANRSAEYIMTFLFVYYGLMFTTNDVLISFPSAIGAVYFIYKITLDKPEGQAYRLMYKYVQIGKMKPTPKKVKNFEI